MQQSLQQVQNKVTAQAFPPPVEQTPWGQAVETKVLKTESLQDKLMQANAELLTRIEKLEQSLAQTQPTLVAPTSEERLNELKPLIAELIAREVQSQMAALLTKALNKPR